jgi:hypothetical protein
MKTRVPRPTGISILAVAMSCMGGMLTFIGLWQGVTIQSVVLVLLGCSWVVVAIGLWSMLAWSRKAAAVLICILILVELPWLPGQPNLVTNLALWAIAIHYLLLRPHVRQAFIRPPNETGPGSAATVRAVLAARGIEPQLRPNPSVATKSSPGRPSPGKARRGRQTPKE